MNQVITPGKIILFGEHSIVYPGNIAILSTVGLYVKCKATRLINSNGIINLKINYHNSVVDIPINIAIAKINYIQATKLRNEFLISNDISTLSKFMELDFGAYYVLIGKIASKLGTIPSMDIILDINIPIGAGMGSSAAIASALIKSIYLVSNVSINNEDLFNITKEIEDFQHGRSSGADPSCVINGGIILYRHELKGKKNFKKILTKLNWDKNLYIINSGKPSESTGIMINKVRFKVNRYPEKFKKYFESINSICKRFMNNEFKDIGELINENGLILEDFGIVNSKVKSFSLKMRSHGGAIKVAGAGGASEIGSGILICKIQDESFLNNLINEYNFSKIITKFGVEGIK